MTLPDALHIADLDAISSPALAIFKTRVQANINRLIALAGGTNRLMPHIKTCKSADAVALMRRAGLDRFKCATIAEAELLAMSGAAEVLLAYQPVGPNADRFIALCTQYRETRFACLADHAAVVATLDTTAAQHELAIRVYLDLDVGMHRTGAALAEAADLAALIDSRPNLILRGLHAYDGHIHDADAELRRQRWTAAFNPVFALHTQLEHTLNRKLELVAGGTPTFLLHLEAPQVTCSPGTFIYWDAGYAEQYPEQPFEPAAWLLGRVISKPVAGKLCLDIGHKAVAAEMPLENRLRFPFDPSFRITGQSEEHLVVETDADAAYQPGDVVYALPWHICPTVALHEAAVVIEAGKRLEDWPVSARKRTLTI